MIERSTDIKAALRSRQRGFLLNPFRFGSGGGGDTDPHFANVVLLLHFDGADGSTTFTDSSPLAQTLSPSGGVKISAAQSKFGGASGFFGGAGTSDALTFGSFQGAALRTGDFTIEMWALFSSVPTSPQALIDYRPNANGPYPTIYASSGKFQFITDSGIAIQGTASISALTWYHLAVSRSGSTLKMFVNGVQDGPARGSTSDMLVGGTGRPFIGTDSFASTLMFGGHIDELRITKGVARYTANFTPPTAPFPNS